MSKFQISEIKTYNKEGDVIPVNEELPVLYKVFVGSNGKYYLHKGKVVRDSAKRLMDDVDRGMRGLKYPEQYAELVAYCKKFPAIYKVTAEVVLNAEADKILKKEKALFKVIKKDENNLNNHNPKFPPYTPEWMTKHSLQKRCENPITEGVVNGKKLKFRFCPNCGRLNK